MHRYMTNDKWAWGELRCSFLILVKKINLGSSLHYGTDIA